MSLLLHEGNLTYDQFKAGAHLYTWRQRQRFPSPCDSCHASNRLIWPFNYGAMGRYWYSFRIIGMNLSLFCCCTLLENKNSVEENNHIPDFNLSSRAGKVCSISKKLDGSLSFEVFEWMFYLLRGNGKPN